VNVTAKALANATVLIITTPQEIIEDWGEGGDVPSTHGFRVRSQLEDLAGETEGGFYVLPSGTDTRLI